jgi:hypothetical protein
MVTPIRLVGRTPDQSRSTGSLSRAPCDTLRGVAPGGHPRSDEDSSTTGTEHDGTGRADGGGPGGTDGVILDQLAHRLDTLRLLREDDPHRADVMLEQFGAAGRVESQMLAQLGQRQPLEIPARFPEAHRTVMRAVEVFDRNAGRPPSSLRVGVLTPAASVVVRLLVAMVARSYQRSVIEHLRRLYALREANSVPGSSEYRMLTLARRQLDRVTEDLSRRTGGLPAFVAGGAALSAVSSLVQEVTGSRVVLVVVALVTAALAAAASWCVITAAAVARRRTRIALDAPLRAVYETLGAAGDPPRDRSRQFVVYAVILLALAWVVAPLALTIALNVV